MIPESRIPFIYVDFDNSRAISPGGHQNYNVLLIGQKNIEKSGESIPESLKPIRVRHENEVADQFGWGSILHQMAKGYFSNFPTAKTYVLPLSDPKAATSSQWKIGLKGKPVGSGIIPLWITGKKMEVVFNEDSTAQEVLNLFCEKINQDLSLPVSSQVSGFKKTDQPEQKDKVSAAVELILTAKNKGELSQSLDVAFEWGQTQQPESIQLKLNSFTPGQGAIDLTEGLSQIFDHQFHLIVCPYLDFENLKRLDEDLKDRFSASRQLEGHLIGAFLGKEADLLDEKKTKLVHSKHMTLLAVGESSPTPAWVWAACLTSIIAKEGQTDPARPFHTLPILGCMAPEESARYERATRSRLLQEGFSTLSVDFNDTPRIERLITTYLNPQSPSDESYLSLNTLLTLSYLRFSFVHYFAAKYPRHKLANDTATLQPGCAILTPQTAKCEAIALFLSWEERGLVENFSQFKTDLIVQRNTKDRGRLDFLMSPRLVSQLNVIGANISFLI